MDAADLATDRASGSRRVSRPTILLLGALLVGVALSYVQALSGIGGIAELVDPVDPDIQAAGIFVGVFLALVAMGCLASSWLTRAAGGDPSAPELARLPVALLGMAIAVVLLVTTATQVLIERAAFTGIDPPAVAQTFTVIDEHRDFRFDRRYLRLRLGTAGRAFNVRVGQAAYDAARAGDEVTLPVQTGRYGIRRAVSDHWIRLADLHHPG